MKSYHFDPTLEPNVRIISNDFLCFSKGNQHVAGLDLFHSEPQTGLPPLSFHNIKLPSHVKWQAISIDQIRMSNLRP